MTDTKESQPSAFPGRLDAHSVWSTGLVTLSFSVLAVILLRTFADPDLWGHLRFGLDTLAAASIITADPYSYVTANQFWINHEWLAEVAMAAAWLSAGTAGLVALRMLVLGLTIGLIYFHLVGVIRLACLPALMILVIAVLGILPLARVVRPQLFTFLLFALMLVVIYQAEFGRYRWLWLTPIIVALWVNLHGGFLAGCGILGLWALLHLSLHRASWRAVIPPVALAAVATLASPYGFGLLAFLLQTATVARPEISDWQPLRITSWYGAIYLGTLAIAVVAIVTSRRRRSVALLAIFAVCALMPLIAVRHLPLLSIAFAVLVGEHVGDVWARRRTRPAVHRTPPRWVLAVPYVGAVAVLAAGIVANQGKIEITDQLHLPDAATSLLVASGASGNLATDFDWGEYLIWHVGPRIQVSIDGRRETVYPPEIYQQNLDLRFGLGEWDAILTEHPTDLALLPRGSAADNLVRLLPGWQLVYADDTSVLFVNQMSPLAASVQRAAATFTAPEQQRLFP